MSSRRPPAVTAAGVLAIVYGSLFVLCGLCGLASLVAQGAMGNNFMAGNDPVQAQLQKVLQEVLERDVAGYHVVQIVSTVLGLAEALVMLIAGIGLLHMRQWARTVALVNCLIAIASTLFQAIYQALLVLPAMSRAFEVALPAALPPGPGPEAAEILRFMQAFMTMVSVGAVILYVALIVYLFIIVFLLCRRQVRLAFAEQGQADFADRSYYGEERLRPSEDDQEWERSRE